MRRRLLLILILWQLVAVGVLWRRHHDDPPTPTRRTQRTADGALLDRRLHELTLNSVPLARALDVLARRTGTNIVARWDELDAAGAGPRVPITLHLGDVSLRTALRGVLETVGGSQYLGFWTRDNVIVLSRAEHAPVETQVYDVRDLIRHEEQWAQPPPISTTQPANLARIWNGPSLPSRIAPNPAEDAAQTLIDLIESTVLPDSWKENGGSSGGIRVFAGLLVVTQTAEAHQQLGSLIEDLRNVLAHQEPQLKPAEAALEQRLPELNLDHVPLSRAISTLSRATGASIFVTWPFLDRQGVTPNTQVSVRLWDVPMHVALTAVLDAALSYTDSKLDYATRDDLIIVSTAGDVGTTPVVRLYDVRDLVRRQMAWLANDPPPEPPRVVIGSISSDWLREHSNTRTETLTDFVNLIENTVAPDTWRDNGGAATLHPLAGVLIVQQSAASHRQVRELLAWLRAAN